MKLSYGELQGKPRILQSLSGLKPDEFEILLESFGQAWEDFVHQTFHGEGRKRAYGAGRKPQLKQLEDKLLFILVYFRLYPTQAVQGFLFGMGQAQANEWVHRLTGVLNRALGYEQQLPEREPAKLEAVLKRCPSLEFMIDGTGRPINRPQDTADRRKYDGGKQQAHTVKNNVISARGGTVLFLSDTYEGKKHDKKIADEEAYRFPQGSVLWQDTGFQGFAPDGVRIKQPKKKPRNGELSDEQKEENRQISKIRVEVEHHIGGIKRCQIVVQKFRNWVDHYIDDVMETACGLHNFRLTHRQKRGDALLAAT
jgi:hypothetical protein